jgi:hypothetical protein
MATQSRTDCEVRSDERRRSLLTIFRIERQLDRLTPASRGCAGRYANAAQRFGACALKNAASPLAGCRRKSQWASARRIGIARIFQFTSASQRAV